MDQTWANQMQTLCGYSRGGVPHGVAPQTPVGGINNLPTANTKGGRAFIPKNQGIPKGFLESHSISNYGWIFSLPATGVNSNGYVTPR